MLPYVIAAVAIIVVAIGAVVAVRRSRRKGSVLVTNAPKEPGSQL